ncbi:MAG TPA: DUF4430 domain-containing protein, partial [Solirubrobacteraceae bacterium]|nr:DUF4430 domain-containing protein [Solirubrobacteraceae bacterium]
MLRVRTALFLAALALACGGCGLGAGPGTKAVTLTVTRGFGSHQIAQIGKSHVPGSETVMRMLERSFPITTRYGGGFVHSIDGLGPSAPQSDWFYYVNGILAPKGAAGTAVHAGDRIWWDLHDYSATQTIPAVVGSFPEPFVSGVGGKRYPVTIECANDVSAACKTVTGAMNAAHVPAAPQLLGTGSGTDTLGIVVGTWGDIRSQVGAQLVAYGPGASGVYARFLHRGGQLALLNPTGHVARTLGAGAGLVAATGDQSTVPTWMITGTDVAGVNAAARALTAQRLHNHFALAVDGST